MTPKSYRSTCRVCATVQTVKPGNRMVPKMYRTADGSSHCVDAVECLMRRHELIDKMQAALDMVWQMLDRLAIRAGWSQ